ncbi:hypothetical protein MC885_009619 [Smutsia gigantea]|nr:hypothetical protein MC885_009619 [Smutsia gigantea]
MTWRRRKASLGRRHCLDGCPGRGGACSRVTYFRFLRLRRGWLVRRPREGEVLCSAERGAREAPRRLAAPSRCSGPASPVAAAAWRRLPPPSRMVLLLAGLGPGSSPPASPVLELSLVACLGRLPAAGREERRRRGCSSRNPTDSLTPSL